MCQGKRRELWDHTAALVTKLHNCNITKESDVISIEDIHPFYMKSKINTPDTPDEIELEKIEREFNNWG